MSDEREEGLGERLGYIVEWAHMHDPQGGSITSEDAHAWMREAFARPDGLCDAMRDVDEQIACAIRELDGQRHALREDCDRWASRFAEADLERHELREMVQAALRDIDALRDDVGRALEERDAAIRERDEALEERDAAQAQRDDMADTVLAERRANARRQEEIERLSARVAKLEAQAEVTPEVESFEAWHARECPEAMAKNPSCKSDPDWKWIGAGGTRFKGRTCREVYEAEVVGGEG